MNVKARFEGAACVMGKKCCDKVFGINRLIRTARFGAGLHEILLDKFERVFDALTKRIN